MHQHLVADDWQKRLPRGSHLVAAHDAKEVAVRHAVDVDADGTVGAAVKLVEDERRLGLGTTVVGAGEEDDGHGMVDPSLVPPAKEFADKGEGPLDTEQAVRVKIPHFLGHLEEDGDARRPRPVDQPRLWAHDARPHRLRGTVERRHASANATVTDLLALKEWRTLQAMGKAPLAGPTNVLVLADQLDVAHLGTPPFLLGRLTNADASLPR
mmetsp:Transcript_14488/g.45527  ORF Transcript_14488/g.45527 Transcript_14488/m.45527 type:complete len:211 (-) Transcript_14488:327-959(-)